MKWDLKQNTLTPRSSRVSNFAVWVAGGAAKVRAKPVHVSDHRSPGNRDRYIVHSIVDRHVLIFNGLPLACLVAALSIQSDVLHLDQASTAFYATVGAASIALVFSTVFAALHHAEAIAHRVGEPYGTLVLTLSVTAIEVSIIVSMMLHGANNPTLARASVFSTVMIVCCGVVGTCLTFGGWRHKGQDIKRQGTSAFLAVLIALSVLTMVLPNFTLANVPGTFAATQLAFVSVLSIFLYGSFVFAQTMGQKGDFMQELEKDRPEASYNAATTPIMVHGIFLLTGLSGIVLLTEQVAAAVEEGLQHFHIAQADAIVGALIALVVLMPEAVSAIKASMANELQRGLNIALGSACATIGLTVPTVAVASLITGRGLTLGLSSGDTVLLLLALAISIVSFGTGRTTVLTGLTHLVVFLAYVLVTVMP
jgi:Ca2+:H+ antiporter